MSLLEEFTEVLLSRSFIDLLFSVTILCSLKKFLLSISPSFKGDKNYRNIIKNEQKKKTLDANPVGTLKKKLLLFFFILAIYILISILYIYIFNIYVIQ